MNYPSLLSLQGVIFFVVILLSTIITIAIAGTASQFFEKKGHKKEGWKEMQQALFTICMILLTVITFFVMNRLYRRFSFSFFIPVLTSTVTIIIILGVFHIPYTSYMTGGHWISSLLEPAVVALAYPLYKQRHFLMTHWIPILGGVLIGAVTGMVSVSLLAKLFAYE